MAARQQQTPTMSPEHFMGKAVLKMTLMEVQQFVEMQFAENPALSVEEKALCPGCGSALSGDFCPNCGCQRIRDRESALSDDDWQYDTYNSAGAGSGNSLEDYFDPFDRVASPKTLSEHLKEQIRLSLDGKDLRTAELIIDLLDADGYLRESLVDIALEVRLSVPQLESIIQEIQALDPPGIAASGLRESLLLQLDRLADDSTKKDLAVVIVRDQWDALSRLKIDKIAVSLKKKPQAVTEAVHFIRENTNPYPASMFRSEWDGLCPNRSARVRPDVIVARTEQGLSAEITDPATGRVAVDGMYDELFSELSRGKCTMSEREKVHVREQVMQAKGLIDALEFRKSSLRRIIDELLICQSEFFTKGALALKPLTKKELSQQIGLSESTVCRATQDKYLRLPTGENIPFDTLFDAALPVREKVRELAALRLSDGEIAARLTESGIQIARRTVAKYRDQLGLLPMDLRLAPPA
jgi:RNA polymerase sigma-54 factor